MLFRSELSPADIGLYGFMVMVDPYDDENECDETNNEADYSDVFCF